MEGVVPFLAIARMIRPLHLAEKPFNGQPPMFREADMLGGTLVVDSFHREVWDAIDVNLSANARGREARPNIVGFGVQGSIAVNMLHDCVMVGFEMGFDPIAKEGTAGGRRGRSAGRWAALRGGDGGEGQVVPVEIHRNEVKVVGIGVTSPERGVKWVGIEALVLGVVLYGLLEFEVASLLDGSLGLVAKEGFHHQNWEFLHRPSFAPFPKQGLH